MADDPDMKVLERGATRSEFLGRGVVLFTGLLSGAASLAGCRQEERNTSDAAERLTALRPTDPKLVKYRESGRIETGLREPRGIAASGDGQTIAVVGDQAMALYTPDGARRQEVQLDADPQCVALAGNGSTRTLVAMADHVRVYDGAGHLAATWPSFGDRAQITAIAVGKDALWVADSGNRLVHRCLMATGSVVGHLGEKNATADYPGLIVPSPHLDVAVSAAGSVYVSNPGMHRVEQHSEDGRCLAYWGAATADIDGFCGCCNPVDFALLPGATGGFVTAEKGIPRVKVYEAAGKFRGVVAGPEAFASSTMGLDLAALPDGRILVLDPKQQAVRVFEPKEGSA